MTLVQEALFNIELSLRVSEGAIGLLERYLGFGHFRPRGLGPEKRALARPREISVLGRQ
jgi:hypothetical protein